MDTKLSEIHAIILMRAVCEDPVAMERWELVMEHLLKPVQKFMMKRISDIEIQVLETLKIWISADVKGGATLRKLCEVFRTESLLALAGRLESDTGAMFVEDPEKVGHVEAKATSRDIYPNLPQSTKSDPYPTLELVGSVRNFVDFSLIPSTQFNYLTEILLSYVFIGHPDRFLDNLSNCKYLRKIHMDKIGCTYFTVNKSIYLPELKHFYLNVLGFTASSTPEHNVISTLNLKPFIFFRTKPQVFKNFGDFLKLDVKIKVSLDDTVIFHSKWSKVKSLTFDYEPNAATLEFVSHFVTHLVIRNCNMSYFFPEKLEKNKVLESIRLENVCLDSGQFLPECKTLLPNLKEFYANFTLKSTDSVSEFDLGGILFFINKADAEGHYLTALRDSGVTATVIGAGRNLIDPDMSKETALTFSYEPSSSQLLCFSKNLKDLTITKCEISDRFSSRLKACVNLEVIRLIDITISGDEQFHHFYSAVLPKLRIFHISQVNRISQVDDEDWHRSYLIFGKISENDWKPEIFLDTGVNATVIVNGQTLFDSNWYDRVLHVLTLDFEPSGPLSKSITYFSKDLIQLNFKNCTLQSKYLTKLKDYCQKLQILQFDDVDLEGPLLEGVEWRHLPPLLKQISFNVNTTEERKPQLIQTLRKKHLIFFTKLGYDIKMIKKVEFLLKMNGKVWTGTGNQFIAKIEPALNDERLRIINQLVLYKCSLSPDFPKRLANCELLEDIRLTRVKLTDDIFNSRVTLPRLKSFHFYSHEKIYEQYFQGKEVDIHQICFFDKNGSWNVSQIWEQNVNIYIFFESSPAEVHFEIVHDSKEVRIQNLPQCPAILSGCTSNVLALLSKISVICSPICDFPSPSMFTSAVTTLTLHEVKNPKIDKFFHTSLLAFQNLKELIISDADRCTLNMHVLTNFRQLKKLFLSNAMLMYKESMSIPNQRKYATCTCETLVMHNCTLEDDSFPQNFTALFRELKVFEVDWHLLKESALFHIQIPEQVMFNMQSVELIGFVRVTWSYFSPRVVQKLQEIDPVFVKRAKKMRSDIRFELHKDAENHSWSIIAENYTHPTIGDEIIRSVYRSSYPFKS